jgi:hypothetical protein
MVVNINSIRIQSGVPLANMWCTHTMPLRPVMIREDTATTG